MVDQKAGGESEPPILVTRGRFSWWVGFLVMEAAILAPLASFVVARASNFRFTFLPEAPFMIAWSFGNVAFMALAFLSFFYTVPRCGTATFTRSGVAFQGRERLLGGLATQRLWRGTKLAWDEIGSFRDDSADYVMLVPRVPLRDSLLKPRWMVRLSLAVPTPDEESRTGVIALLTEHGVSRAEA